MDTINTKRAALLKKLKQRLEDSWSGFTQVIEEAEEFLEDIRDAQENNGFDVGLVSTEYAKKDCTLEELETFYEDYIDNLKFQAEGLQHETQQAIDKLEGTFNISYMKEEV
mgnify:CR=1 FL=1